ncbi:MAG: ComF family protein [Paludibacteraceae bacterium]|nr:ComF family protein [Paludibacteraceae bacterium]
MTSRILQILKSGWNGLMDLFYPPLCYACGKYIENQENILCEECKKALPRTEHYKFRNNKVEMLFWDISKLQRGGAFCFYEHGSDFRRLIHLAKYYGRPQIGEYLGSLAAEEYQKNGFFDGVDLLVPVPLHPKRQRQRGYNQAEHICKGISKITGIPVDTTHLVRTKNNESQTHKTTEQRRLNTENIFQVRQPQAWRHKHIMLIDDVITTGSTIHACIKVITPIIGTRISVFALGMAGGRPQKN